MDTAALIQKALGSVFDERDMRQPEGTQPFPVGPSTFKDLLNSLSLLSEEHEYRAITVDQYEHLIVPIEQGADLLSMAEEEQLRHLLFLHSDKGGVLVMCAVREEFSIVFSYREDNPLGWSDEKLSRARADFCKRVSATNPTFDPIIIDRWRRMANCD